ncbi:glutaredoxin-C8-like [Argonauta hians]
MAKAESFVNAKMRQREVVLFCKRYIPACQKVIRLLEQLDLDENTYEVVYIDKRQDIVQIQNYFQVLCLTDRREVPQLFIKGRYFGGAKEIFYWKEKGKLLVRIGIFLGREVNLCRKRSKSELDEKTDVSEEKELNKDIEERKVNREDIQERKASRDKKKKKVNIQEKVNIQLEQVDEEDEDIEDYIEPEFIENKEVCEDLEEAIKDHWKEQTK